MVKRDLTKTPFSRKFLSRFSEILTEDAKLIDWLIDAE